jgi:hypothetical protein
VSILQIETVASLQPHSIILYKSFPASSRKSGGDASLLNLAKKEGVGYNGYMSPATGRKVRKYLGTWLLALQQNMTDRGGRGTKYYPTFVTLTLASKQQHDDNYIKRNLLNRFIIRVQKLFGVKYFFWRAEPQENGNLHFHLIIDRWAKWETLRAEWNAIQAAHGYIDAYRLAQEAKHLGGFKFNPKAGGSKAAQRKAYDEGVACNWSNPNSTDVHKINKLESLTAYVVKYVCKRDEPAPQEIDESGELVEATGGRRKIRGRIWGCSDELRNFKYYADTLGIEENFQMMANPEMVDYVSQVEQEVGPSEVFEDEFIKVVRLKKPQAHYLKKYAPGMHRDYSNHYRNIYKDLYEAKPEKTLFEPVEAVSVAPEYEPELFKPKIVQIGMQF